MFAVSSTTVDGCITPFCLYSFLNVCGITSHSGLNTPKDGRRQCICLIFCYWKGWKFACKPNCMAGDYKMFSFQIWFSPLWIFLACSKARFVLTSPDWGGAHNHAGKCSVAWKSSWLEGEQFFRSSQDAFSSHPISLHTHELWWDMVTAWSCHLVLMKVIISHDAAPPQQTVASCCCKSCIQEITSVFHFVSRHQNSGKELMALSEPLNCSCNHSKKQIKNPRRSGKRLNPSILSQCCASAVVWHHR